MVSSWDPLHRRDAEERVRLTFPKGAQIKDPSGLFNTRLDSKTVRAIDIREGDVVNDAALTALVREAMRLNED